MSARAKLRIQAQVVRCADEKLCLALVNTVAWRKSGNPEERLGSPVALIDWCIANVADARSTNELAEWLEDAPNEVALFHQQVTEFREAIYALFLSRIEGRAMAATDLGVLNDMLTGLPPRLALASCAEGIGWRAESHLSKALEIMALIAWSAADLLSGPRIDRVKQCEDSRGCAWLFLDESRGSTRRWCSMGDCGNRAKAHRHYLRTLPKNRGEN